MDKSSNHLNKILAEEYGSPLKLSKRNSSLEKMKKNYVTKITPIDELEQSLRRIVDNQYFDQGGFNNCKLINLNFDKQNSMESPERKHNKRDENENNVAFSPESNFSE